MPIDPVTTNHSPIIPETPTQTHPLKTIHPLSSDSNILLQKGIQFKDKIPQPYISSSNPFQNVEVIFFEWYPEEPEPGWCLADPAPYIPPNEEENLTVEELLRKTGYMFASSRDLQIIPCKSAKKVLVHWWKVGTKWVKEHKKELIVGGVILGVGGGIALGVTLLTSTAAAETALATTAAVGTAVASSSKRKEEELEEKPQETQGTASSPPPPSSTPIIGYELPKERPPIEKELPSPSSHGPIIPSVDFHPSVYGKTKNTNAIPTLFNSPVDFADPRLYYTQIQGDAKTYFDYLSKYTQNTPPPNPQSETNVFSAMFQTIQKGFAFLGAQIIDNNDLFLPNSPYDPFAQAYEDLMKKYHIPAPTTPSSIPPFLSVAPLKSTYTELLNLLACYDGSRLQRPLHKQPPHSIYFTIAGATSSKMQVTIANGMANNYLDALSNANYLRSMTPLQMEGIYNCTNSIPIGLAEITALNLAGHSPIMEELIMKKFINFAKANKDDPHAKCLHTCHSQSALHTRNALEKLPREIQERVIVVNIAGACMVPKRLCFHSHNYASEKDIVYLLSTAYTHFTATGGYGEKSHPLLEQERLDAKELIVLKAHEGAKGLDHEFQSPTYAGVLREHLEDYVMHEGQY